MASTAERKEQIAYRQDYILAVLKQKSPDTIVLKDIAKSLGVTAGTVSRDIHNLKGLYPKNLLMKKANRYGAHGGQVSGYFWKFDEMEKVDLPEQKVEVVPFDRYPVTKNDEGYADPTAALAIMNSEGNQSFGDIYEYLSNHGYEKFLVLASTEKFVTGCVLYEKWEDIDDKEKPAVVKLATDEGTLFYNPTKIYTKPVKYLSEKVETIDISQGELFKSKVMQYLGIGKIGIDPAEVAEKDKLIEDQAKNINRLAVMEVNLSAELEELKQENERLNGLLSDISKKGTTDETRIKLEIYEDLIDRIFPRA